MSRTAESSMNVVEMKETDMAWITVFNKCTRKCELESQNQDY